MFRRLIAADFVSDVGTFMQSVGVGLADGVARREPA